MELVDVLIRSLELVHGAMWLICGIRNSYKHGDTQYSED
jgi:hypothetical protein